MSEVKLTTEQQSALDGILKQIEENPFGMATLSGYAGTGKTTLMGALTKALKGNKRIFVTAPTNKAVKVLSTKIDSDVPCQTIHSLIGLIVQYEKGKPVLRKKESDIPEIDVLIVDECSMIGTNLLQFIEKYVRSAFILFVGDEAQLRPVDTTKAISKTFEVQDRYKLTSIIRQAADNPIIATSMKIRESKLVLRSMFEDDRTRDDKGIFQFPNTRLQTLLERAFKIDGQYDNNPDSFRCIAYRNATVSTLNHYVRECRYGADIALNTRFVEGEYCIARSPLMNVNSEGYWSTEFNTNDEAKITSIEKSTLKFCEREITGYNVVLDGRAKGFIFDNSLTGRNLYDEILDELYKEGISGEGKEKFDLMTELRNKVWNIQPPYAMTAHVSQGSTFKNVFIDLNDLLKSNESKELLYVAVTRASEKVIILDR